jgi:hypothetical protein
LRVAPGVAVARTGSGVTLLGPVEIRGRLPAVALGARICREAELRDPRGAVVGRAAPGALVRSSGAAGSSRRRRCTATSSSTRPPPAPTRARRSCPSPRTRSSR